MTHFIVPALERRRVLLAGAASLAAAFPGRTAYAGSPEIRQLEAGPARASLLGADAPHTPVWAYNGTIPGPVIRVRQGEMLRIHMSNGLPEDTTVHWHGIRLPNAMDGVPGLTQPPIRPGAAFSYAFAPPDAGTFWYHPHDNSLEQMSRGLAGVLIVEEPEPPPFDRDWLWVLDDWVLRQSGQVAPGFGSPMDAMMAGRIGNLVTVNGSVRGALPVQAGERVRLRLANVAVARIMALRFEGHHPIVIAYDGQPCDPHEPAEGRILLGPGMRADIALDLDGTPGQRYRVVDEFYDSLAYTLAELAYSPASPVRSNPPGLVSRLPANPLPEPDLAKAARHVVALQGGGMGGMGMMGGMMGGGALWSINGVSMTGDAPQGAPMLRLPRGTSHVLVFRNETAWWHPMHLHGHSLKLLRRNGVAGPHQIWGDTVLVPPRQTVEAAFVADNPGQWLLHCHVMDHQMAGLMTLLQIA